MLLGTGTEIHTTVVYQTVGPRFRVLRADQGENGYFYGAPEDWNCVVAGLRSETLSVLDGTQVPGSRGRPAADGAQPEEVMAENDTEAGAPAPAELEDEDVAEEGEWEVTGGHLEVIRWPADRDGAAADLDAEQGVSLAGAEATVPTAAEAADNNGVQNYLSIKDGPDMASQNQSRAPRYLVGADDDHDDDDDDDDPDYDDDYTANEDPAMFLHYLGNLRNHGGDLSSTQLPPTPRAPNARGARPDGPPAMPRYNKPRRQRAARREQHAANLTVLERARAASATAPAAGREQPEEVMAENDTEAGAPAPAELEDEDVAEEDEWEVTGGHLEMIRWLADRDGV